MPAIVTPLAYRPKDAATMLGISRSTIYEMIAHGTLSSFKLGTATVIRHDELARVLESAPLSTRSKRATASRQHL